MENLPTIISTAAASITAAYLAYNKIVSVVKKKKAKREPPLEEDQGDYNKSSYDRLIDLKITNTLQRSSERMFTKTKASKLVILVAINGEFAPNRITAIFEERQDRESRLNSVSKYNNIVIDDHFKMLLKKVEKEGYVLNSTMKMPGGLLKTFYYLDEVTHSLIYFIKRESLSSNEDVIVFCSVETQASTKFTQNEIIQIKTEIEGKITPAIEDLIKDDYND